MKILIYYSINDSEVKRSFNFHYYQDIQFTCVHNEISFLKNYEHQHFDIVLINLSSQHSTKILNHIIKHNANQKIVVLCNEINQCINFDCTYCNETLNIKRVLNTIEIKELVMFFIQFHKKECRYYENIGTSTVLIEDLSKKFIFYKLNKEKTLLSKRENSIFQLAELLDITHLLKRYKINYTINQDENILIQH